MTAATAYQGMRRVDAPLPRRGPSEIVAVPFGRFLTILLPFNF